MEMLKIKVIENKWIKERLKPSYKEVRTSGRLIKPSAIRKITPKRKAYSFGQKINFKGELKLQQTTTLIYLLVNIHFLKAIEFHFKEGILLQVTVNKEVLDERKMFKWKLFLISNISS